ncbi:MAG: DUF4097 family beta strand repeat-containing protein [bacterium]|nr:DUF4097 family beta strand repeat-containing protein [bacterium]
MQPKLIVLIFIGILVLGLFATQTPHSASPPITNQEAFTKQIMVPANTKILEINHRSGNVNVEGWDKPFILLEGTKGVVANDPRTAQLATESIQIVAFEKSGNRLALEYHGPGSSSDVQVEEKDVNFVLHVPSFLALDMDVRQGRIGVKDIQNHVSIDHRDGDVKAESIQGKLQIRSKKGNITVRSVKQSLRMDTRDGTVSIQDVGWDLAIQHQYGDVTINQVGGSVVFNGYEAPVLITNIKGRLEIDNRRGDVECLRFEDALDVYINHGTLKADAGKILAHNYYCRIDDGDVILRIPQESSALFDIRVENGRIHSDFHMPLWADGKVSVAKGAMKDGRNMVSCWVRKGTVSILKSSSIGGTGSRFTAPSYEPDPLPTAQAEPAPLDLTPARVTP